eukprot:GHRR01035059.1.p1 GENE.GHRR01035059.1~~GHRR01035059.1.p1  ORF type:complete len:152 (-),score=20.37 GHRR01035059.1:182-601(-)
MSGWLLYPQQSGQHLCSELACGSPCLKSIDSMLSGAWCCSSFAWFIAQVRKAFTAEVGKTLVVADYGQLELRLLAHMADCKSMIRAFELGGDFHSRCVALTACCTCSVWAKLAGLQLLAGTLAVLVSLLTAKVSPSICR